MGALALAAARSETASMEILGGWECPHCCEPRDAAEAVCLACGLSQDQASAYDTEVDYWHTCARCREKHPSVEFLGDQCVPCLEGVLGGDPRAALLARLKRDAA